MQIHSPFSSTEGIISVASSPLSGRGRVIYLFVLLGGKPAGTSLSVWKCMRVRPLCISTHVCHQITCIKCLGKHKTFMCLLPVLPLGGKSERGRGGLTPSELAHTHTEVCPVCWLSGAVPITAPIASPSDLFPETLAPRPAQPSRGCYAASRNPAPYITVSGPDLPLPCSLISTLSPYSTFLANLRHPEPTSHSSPFFFHPPFSYSVCQSSSDSEVVAHFFLI